MDKFICYLDILGFQNRIKKTGSGFKKLYDKLIKEISSDIAPYNKINLYAWSDGLLILADQYDDTFSVSFDIYKEAIISGIFIRGAITKGDVDWPVRVHEAGGSVIIPYIGRGFLRAYELEQETNCSAIRVDEQELNHFPETIVNEFLFSCEEVFPKKGTETNKTFLITDMANNWNVTHTILSSIWKEIPKIAEHDKEKFINTFNLYYKAMKYKWKNSDYLKEYDKQWVNLLNASS